MAAGEGLTLNGVNLNDGTNFSLRGVQFPPPKKRQEWIQGADADGSALVRDPLLDNREVTVRIRVNPASTLTMDQALAKVGQLVDLIEEAEKQPDGLQLAWTPSQGSKVISFYVLSGEVSDLPIEKDSQTSGWFRKAPTITLVFQCKPRGYGQPVDTITDDFSTNTIANYSFDTGGGTLSVTSGQLVPSSTAEKRLYRSLEALTYCDSQVTVKVVTGASVASGSTEAVGTRLDASNYLIGGVNFAGAASTLTIKKVVAGTPTTLATGGAFTTAAATSYWVRMRAEKNLITVELWTAQPTTTTSAAQSLTYTLGGGDATQFGQGIMGQSGLRLIPQATDYRWDDFELAPNIWKSSGPTITGLVPAIAGDIPAEGRLIFIDAAAQSRRHVEFGADQRYYSAGVPRILDQFATDTITSGAWAVDSGGGTIAVSGGLLVPSSTAEKRLHRTDSGGASGTDCQTTVKVTTGASVASGSSGLIARWTADTDFLFARLNFTGATSNLTIHKRVAGTDTTLATSGNTTTVVSTSYWVRFVVQGTTLTATYYTADPATGAAATSSVSYTLTTAEAIQFISGQTGLRLVPAGTDYRWDDFRAQALAGATDQLDSEDLAISGFAGTQTTRTGASSGGTVANHVIRGTLTTVPVAVCGLGNLGHVGTFRIKARVYPVIGTTTATDLKVRLSWKEGDGPLRSNDYTTCPAGSGAFSEVDLGFVTIPQKTLGTQRWTGQIEAYSTTAGDTLDIDYVEIIPTEVYGKGRMIPPSETPSAFSARDGFDQTAGGLGTQVLPVGGSWTTTGAVGDFAVESTGHTAQRTTTGDAAFDAGRFGIAGTTVFTNTGVQADFKTAAFLSTSFYGVFARYGSITSNLIGGVFVTGTGTGYEAQIMKLAGGTAIIGRASIPAPAAATFYSVRLTVDAGGGCALWVWQAGAPAPSTPTVQAAHADLATGGTLASGKVGIYDEQKNATANTRNYDNFAAWVAGSDAVIFSGLAAEIRYDQAIRQDSTGAYYGPIQSYRGGRMVVPAAGSAGRTLHIVGKARRNDVDVATDDQIADATWMQFKYTPAYLVIPR